MLTYYRAIIFVKNENHEKAYYKVLCTLLNILINLCSILFHYEGIKY